MAASMRQIKPGNRPERQPALWSIALLALATLTACRGDRILRIESTPPGATVRLDDKVVGRTPIDIPFAHYGRRRLSLYRPGYRTHAEALKLDAPWWARFPLDIVTEVLLPFGFKDVRNRQILLVPDTGEEAAPATAEFVEHAMLARSGDPLLDVPASSPSDADAKDGDVGPDDTGPDDVDR